MPARKQACAPRLTVLSTRARRFLRRLLLDNNAIGRIQGIASLAHLQYLSLSNNQIQSIEGLDSLPIKHLDLANNQIQRLENLHTLVLLQVLVVSGNQISSLSGLQNCKALNVLEAKDNTVGNIHEVSAA